MNRAEKSSVVAEVKEDLSGASLIVVAQHSGLTVGEMTALRRQMRDVLSDFRVVKNTLLCLAAKDTPFEGLSPLFKGPTAIAYSKDPIAAAKAAVKFSKDNAKLQVLGGFMSGKVLQKAEVHALAELPSLDELRAKILSVISAPATKLAVLFKEPQTRVARVLSARASE